ncbi:toxin glutamine deamidase domain-containing protein [Actinomadura sp. DC4]|uniref:toxin glutamine deamidase domain-containing protein n=1 Tax=Actinomadura sp. DC4 TaxID=3055069 RepID=UPI0025AFCA4A|nr:toxin glutamine deamidase domain-containing protein [Actinomadura sp. DC4]MDN3358141.1 toxin glutamine deamidase domain-containing protein [Actinomadura sp. DC4]
MSASTGVSMQLRSDHDGHQGHCVRRRFRVGADLMALDVPEGVRGLFLVLTGEKWPSVDEDALRAAGHAWGTAGDRLKDEAGPYLLSVVQDIRENFTGKSAIKFAEVMGPYVADPPYYIPAAAEQFAELEKFLLDASTQVEYVKIISINEVVLLIAQIAWAIAMAVRTAGASMIWLAARFAIVRFLLSTLWGRLILQFALAQLFGIGFQVALDVLVQAVQFAKGTRTKWDAKSTLSAVEVGAVGGALALPFAAISHALAHKLTGVLSKVMGQKVNLATLSPVAIRAVNEAAENLGHTPVSTLTKTATRNVAKDITDGVFRAADKPLRVRLTEIGVPAVIEMVEEGLHEVITEGIVMAANGQGFKFNPYSFTSGMAGNVATKLGDGIGTSLAGAPKAHGYTRLPDETNTTDEAGDTGDLDSEKQPLLLGSSGPGSTSFSDTTKLVDDLSENKPGDEESFLSRPPSRSSSSTLSEDETQTDGGSTTSTSPPVPAIPAMGGRRSAAESAAPVPSENGTGSNRTVSSTTEPSTDPSTTKPSTTVSSTSMPSSSGKSNTDLPTSEPTPARPDDRGTGKRTERAGSVTRATAGQVTEGTGTTRPGASGNGNGNGNGTSATRPATQTPATRGAGNRTSGESTTSDSPVREGTRSATPTPGTTSNSTKQTEPEVTEQAVSGANNTGSQTTADPGAQTTPATRPPGHNAAENRQEDKSPFRNGTAAEITAARASAESLAVLPESLTSTAATVDAQNLAELTIDSLPLAERLVVIGPAEVGQVKAAVERLGIEVVALVDRRQIGAGQPGRVQWMAFPPAGRRARRRPEPVAVLQGQVTPVSLAGDRLPTRTAVKEAADKAAAAAKKVEDARGERPGPWAGEEWGQYCLAMVEELAGRLFPGGIRTGQVRDDGLVGAGAGGTRRYLGVPATMWAAVSDWNTLVEEVTAAEVGAAAFVVLGRPSEIGHAVVLTRTSDQGVVLVDPTTPGEHTISPVTAIRPPQGTGHGPTIGEALQKHGRGLESVAETRALIITPHGQALTPTPTFTPFARALTDPTHPYTGAPRERRADTWKAPDPPTSDETPTEDTWIAPQAPASGGRRPTDDRLREFAARAHREGVMRGDVFGRRLADAGWTDLGNGRDRAWAAWNAVKPDAHPSTNPTDDQLREFAAEARQNGVTRGDVFGERLADAGWTHLGKGRGRAGAAWKAVKTRTVRSELPARVTWPPQPGETSADHQQHDLGVEDVGEGERGDVIRPDRSPSPPGPAAGQQAMPSSPQELLTLELEQRGRRMVRMPGDGDCFFSSLLFTAGHVLPQNMTNQVEIRRYLAAQLRVRTDLQNMVAPLVRRFLAEERAETFADQHGLDLARLSRDEREGLIISANREVNQDDWEWFAGEIETPQWWRNIGGDITPLLAARLFDLRIDVVNVGRDNVRVVPVGDGPHRITLVRAGYHWDATVDPTAATRHEPERAPTPPWRQRRPGRAPTPPGRVPTPLGRVQRRSERAPTPSWWKQPRSERVPARQWPVPPPSAAGVRPPGPLPSFGSMFGGVPEPGHARTADSYGVQLVSGERSLLDAVLDSAALTGIDVSLMRETAENRLGRRQDLLDDPEQVASVLPLRIVVITPGGQTTIHGEEGLSRVVIARSRSGWYLPTRPADDRPFSRTSGDPGPSRFVGAADMVPGEENRGLAWWHPAGDVGEVFAERYGWVATVNEGDGSRTRTAPPDSGLLLNCLLTAIATHMGVVEPDKEFTAPAYSENLPRTGLPIKDLVAYGNDSRGPVPDATPPRVLRRAGVADIVVAVDAAGPGAHGFVVVNSAGGARGHVFNVVRDADGVIFLDGQTGRPAVLPDSDAMVLFMPVGAVEIPESGSPVDADTTGHVGGPVESQAGVGGQHSDEGFSPSKVALNTIAYSIGGGMVTLQGATIELSAMSFLPISKDIRLEVVEPEAPVPSADGDGRTTPAVEQSVASTTPPQTAHREDPATPQDSPTATPAEGSDSPSNADRPSSTGSVKTTEIPEPTEKDAEVPAEHRDATRIRRRRRSRAARRLAEGRGIALAQALTPGRRPAKPAAHTARTARTARKDQRLRDAQRALRRVERRDELQRGLIQGEAREIVEHLLNADPHVAPNQVRQDEVGDLVAAEIVRAGHMAAVKLANTLLSLPRRGGGVPVTDRPVSNADTAVTDVDRLISAAHAAVVDVRRAQLTLELLSPNRFTRVMRRTQQIVGDLTGRVPADRFPSGELSRVDRVGLLVAAEIARSGLASGKALARDLAPIVRPDTTPRVAIDHDRVETALGMMRNVKSFSPEQYTQILLEARVIVSELTGHLPPRPKDVVDGLGWQLVLVWTMVASELARAGHRSAEKLGRDIIGLPRLESRLPSWLAAFVDGSRTDLDRARTMLALYSDEQVQEFTDEAARVIEGHSELSSTDDGHVVDSERALTLVAAEIARTGREAAEDLAWQFATEASRDQEPGHVTPDPPSDQAAPMSLSEMTDDPRTLVSSTADGRAVAIWLPGAPEHGLPSDVTMAEQLAELMPEADTVFVLGAERDGKVMVGDRPVSADTLYATIVSVAPGRRPFLLIPGAAAMAEPLAERFNGPVYAAPDSMRFEPENTRLLFARLGRDGLPVEEPYRRYVAGDPEGVPIAASLTTDLRRQREMLEADSSSSVDGRPSSRQFGPGSPMSRPPRPDSRTTHTGISVMSHMSALRGTRGSPVGERHETPDPDAPETRAVVIDPWARSVGVPRARLPYMRELVGAIERHDLFRRKRITFSDRQRADFEQRLLSNFPYLLDSGSEQNASGLVVPFRGREILVTFNPQKPRRVVRNPGGSYIATSELPAPDGEFGAVDTINAAYGTGAHAQTQSGQTGATRGRIAGAIGTKRPGSVLSAVNVGLAISGTANQSNLSSTHIGDAERGKNEDGRLPAPLIAYSQVNISFKVREQSGHEVDRWEEIDPIPVPESGKEELELFLAEPYTEKAASRTVTATGSEVEEKQSKLPRTYYASGLTEIPRLFDEILVALDGQGLMLKPESSTRKELLQKVWNLNTFLDDAVNERQGYEITLHGDRGLAIATVRVRSRRLYKKGAPLVGAMSDKVHLEDVRTAIDGTGGAHTLNQSTTLAPNLELDFLTGSALGINVGVPLSYSSSNSDSISAARNGLWVMVPRYTGLTAAYQITFEHRADVRVIDADKGQTRTTAIQSSALVRMPVTEAFAHGFAVDREALTDKALNGAPANQEPVRMRPGSIQMPWVKNAVKHSGRGENDPEDKSVPLHVEQGKGIGMGLVRVEGKAVDTIRKAIEDEVSRHGFLPDYPHVPRAGQQRPSHRNLLESQVDNRELLTKMVSPQGLDSFYDQIHQGGMTFTLNKREGITGVDLLVHSVRITIQATKSAKPKYLRTTSEYHTVNLAMGMDIASQSTGHSRSVSAGLSFRGVLSFLGATVGLTIQKTVGASDSVSFLNNRPELLEFPGDVDEFELTSDYRITFDYDRSGLMRKLFTGYAYREIGVTGQTAVVNVLPLGTEAQRGPTMKAGHAAVRNQPGPGPETKARPAPAMEGPDLTDLLDQGVVFFVDASGLREAASEVLTDLVGPAATGDQDISTFTSLIEVRAHLREILRGEYTTNRLFDTGLWVHTYGGLDISGALRDVTFSGSTGEKFVKGDIKLLLTENRLTDNDSWGITWGQLDISGGGGVGHANVSGGVDMSRRWQWNTSKSSGRTGGKELIQLDFNHAYAFTSQLIFKVRARQEKQAKFFPTLSRGRGGGPAEAVGLVEAAGSGKDVGPAGVVRPVEDGETLTRTMMFLLSEPEALKRYAQGKVPISFEQLEDALTRWKTGELPLSNDVVAGVLTRWANDPELGGHPRLRDEIFGVLAPALVAAHQIGVAPVVNTKAIEDFDATFPVPLGEAQDPFAHHHFDLPQDLLNYVLNKGEPPTNKRLRDAMADWEGGRLKLGGDVVAKVLIRWRGDDPDAYDYQQQLADRLYDLHSTGGLPIRELHTRETFDDEFPSVKGPLPEPKIPLRHMELPEYLTRDDPGGRMLGHSGIQSYTHEGGQTTYAIVRAQIERVAPGALARGAEIWSAQGRLLGKSHGGVDALQAMMAKGRDLALFEELLSTNGISFYLVNPLSVLLEDVVEINLSSVLTSQPTVLEAVPNTGIEVYSHGYHSSSITRSRSTAQSFGAKLNAGSRPAKTAPGVRPAKTGSGGGALRTSMGNSRGTTRADQGVVEQTVYDWSGHYLVSFDEQMTVKVRRLKMNKRLPNNWMLDLTKYVTHHGDTETSRTKGKLVLQVPRGIAEAGVSRGPSERPNFVPLPKLPGDSFIAGTLLDDALPIAKKMLAEVFKTELDIMLDQAEEFLRVEAIKTKLNQVMVLFGVNAGDPDGSDDSGTTSSLSLPVLLSRLHLTNHLREATGGDTYPVARGLVMPGTSDTRVDLDLKGDLYDFEVIAPIKEGTGTGRYSKHQSGTTASANTTRARLELDYNGDGQGPASDRPPRTWDFGNSGSRITSMNQDSAGTATSRREQHAKEQGPVYMIRLRFRGWLEARKFEHSLFEEPRREGTFRSDPISGDLYAELFQAEIEELRAQREQKMAAKVQPSTVPWSPIDTTPIALAPLLATAARDKFDVLRAYQSVARQIRTQGGGERPIVIEADEMALSDMTYRALLPWTVKNMAADFAAAQNSDLSDKEKMEDRNRLGQRLAHYQQELKTQLPDEVPAGQGVDGVPPGYSLAEVHEMVRDAQQMHAHLDERVGPLPLPPEASFLSLDPVLLARNVAHSLATNVRVDVRASDGKLTQSWIDKQGRMPFFDPTRTRVAEDGRLYVVPRGAAEEQVFNADLAREKRLLRGSLFRDAKALLSDARLGRAYRTAMAGWQPFEQAFAQAVAEEIAACMTQARVAADGRLYFRAPHSRKERAFTADLAINAGLLPESRRTDVGIFLGDVGLGRIHQTATARRQPFEEAVAEEIAARRERLAALDQDLPKWISEAFDVFNFWQDEVTWRKALNRELAEIENRIEKYTGPQKVSRGRQDRPAEPDKLRAERLRLDSVKKRLERLSESDTETERDAARELLEGLQEIAAAEAGHPSKWSAKDGPVTAQTVDLLSSERWLSTRAVDAFRNWPVTETQWQDQANAQGLARLRELEKALREAGPGSISILSTRKRNARYVAAYQHGQIRWVEYPLESRIDPPAQSRVQASLDLAPGGIVLNPPPGLAELNLDRATIERIRSFFDDYVKKSYEREEGPPPSDTEAVTDAEALTDVEGPTEDEASRRPFLTVPSHQKPRRSSGSLAGRERATVRRDLSVAASSVTSRRIPTIRIALQVPEDLMLRDAHLFRNADREYEFRQNASEVRRGDLAVAPYAGFRFLQLRQQITARDIGNDYPNAVRFLTSTGDFTTRAGGAIVQLGRTPSTARDPLTDLQIADTWFVFSDGHVTGAAIRTEDGRYQTYVPRDMDEPGDDIGTMTLGELRQIIPAGSSIVGAPPSVNQTVPILELERRDTSDLIPETTPSESAAPLVSTPEVPEGPHEQLEITGPIPNNAQVYRREGMFKVDAGGMAHGGWERVAAFSEFVRLYWGAHRATERRITSDDAVRSERDRAEAAQLFARLQTPGQVVEGVMTYLRSTTDRTVEVVRSQPVRPRELEPGTFIWFIRSDLSNDAVVMMEGVYRRYRPLEEGRIAESDDLDALDALMNGARVFVVARPVPAGRTAEARLPGQEMETTAADPETSGVPAPPVVRVPGSPDVPVVGEAPVPVDRADGSVRGDTEPQRATGTTGAGSVERVAPLPISGEHADNRRELEQILAPHNLRAVNVLGQGDCFYLSLIAVAGPYLAHHVPGVFARPRTGESDASVIALRNWLADRLEADIAVGELEEELPTRYGGSIPEIDEYGEPVDIQAWITSIRTLRDYKNQAGELVANLAAIELGLPMTLIQYGQENLPLGPPGAERIYFVREQFGDYQHYLGIGAAADDEVLPFGWNRLAPAESPTVEDARRRLRSEIESVRRSLEDAVEAFNNALERLPEGTARRLPRSQENRSEIDPGTLAADGRAALHVVETLAPNKDLPRRLRFEQRLDAMSRVVGTIRDPAQRLNGLAALLWLMKGQPDQATIRAAQLDSGLAEALASLADSDDMPQWVTTTLGTQVGQRLKVTHQRPEGLPAGTWIWFSAARFNGAAVVRPNGSLRFNVPGQEPDAGPRLFGEATKFVTVTPEQRGVPSAGISEMAGFREALEDLPEEPEGEAPEDAERLPKQETETAAPPIPGTSGTSRPADSESAAADSVGRGTGLVSSAGPSPVATVVPASGPQVVRVPGVPADLAVGDAHLYEDAQGHGVGGVGPVGQSWRHVGALSDYSGVFWLTHGSSDRGVTVGEIVAEPGLAGAVGFLTNSAGLPAGERVAGVLREQPGRVVEQAGELPADLPQTTWIWFSGEDGRTGASVVLGAGRYRTYMPGRRVSVQEPGELGQTIGRPQTLVIARPDVRPGPVTVSGESSEVQAGHAGSRTTSGRGPTRDFPGSPAAGTETAPSQAAEEVPAVDEQVSVGRHLDVGGNGSRFAGPIVAPRDGSRGREAISTYMPLGWLLDGGREQPLSDRDVTGPHRHRVETFLTEAATVLGEPVEAAEMARALLEAATGTDRRVEVASGLPGTLPPGTWIYHVGPGGNSGAAVVLPSGQVRRTVLDGTPTISSGLGDLRAIADGQRRFVIAAPRQRQRPAGDVVRRPASDTPYAAATALGLRPVNVPGDNNCFYHSLILMAGGHLARQPGMAHLNLDRKVSGDLRVRRANVQIVRRWLANRLSTDLKAAREGLPSRYAESVQPDDPRTIVRTEKDVARLHGRAVSDIATMDSWANNMGDVVVGLAARELGLPMTVIQAGFDTPMGPDGDARLYVILQSEHYLGTETLPDRPPAQIPWERLSPLPPSTSETARTEMRLGTNAARMRLSLAQDAYLAAQGDVTGSAYWRAVSAFRRAETGTGYGYENLLSHVLAGERIDGMRRAVADIETLTEELQSTPAEPTAFTPEQRGESSIGAGGRAAYRQDLEDLEEAEEVEESEEEGPEEPTALSEQMHSNSDDLVTTGDASYEADVGEDSGTTSGPESVEDTPVSPTETIRSPSLLTGAPEEAGTRGPADRSRGGSLVEDISQGTWEVTGVPSDLTPPATPISELDPGDRRARIVVDDWLVIEVNDHLHGEEFRWDQEAVADRADIVAALGELPQGGASGRPAIAYELATKIATTTVPRVKGGALGFEAEFNPASPVGPSLAVPPPPTPPVARTSERRPAPTPQVADTPAKRQRGGTRGRADRLRGGAGEPSELGPIALNIYRALTNSQGVLPDESSAWRKSSHSTGKDCVEVAAAESSVWPG